MAGMREVGKVLGSLEDHAHELDRELRQIEADIELNRVMEKKYGKLFCPGITHLRKLAHTREEKLGRVIGQVEGWRTSISHGQQLIDTLDHQMEWPTQHNTSVNLQTVGSPDHMQEATGTFRVVSTTSPILVHSSRSSQFTSPSQNP